MATTTEAGSASTSAGGWHIGWGVLLIVCGIIAILMPEVAALALMVGAFLFASGIARTVCAFRTRPRRGWGWVLFDGLLSLALAILIAIGWPQSSLAFIGLLTGFTLISTGLWRILLRHPLPA